MSELVATTFLDKEGRSHVIVGTDLPTRHGLALFHYEVELDGELWTAGDVFYLIDHHGVPRDHVFSYWNPERAAAVNGGVTCFSKHRYRRHAAGFHSMLPTRAVAVSMDADRLKLEQLISDIVDLDIPDDERDVVNGRLDKMRRDWPTAAATTRSEIISRAERIRDKWDTTD